MRRATGLRAGHCRHPSRDLSSKRRFRPTPRIPGWAAIWYEAGGPQQIIVRLQGAPMARGGNKADIEVEQAQFLQRCGALPSARVIAQVDTVLNAVFLEVDASDLPAMADDAAVRSTIKKVVDYELELSETVPYIGGTATAGVWRGWRGHLGGRARQRHRLHARRPRRLRARWQTMLRRMTPSDPRTRATAVPHGKGRRRLRLRRLEAGRSGASRIRTRSTRRGRARHARCRHHRRSGGVAPGATSWR